MRRYVIRRLLLAVPTLLGVSVLVFSMLQLIPGDPVMMMMRHSGTHNIDIELVRHRMGLDLPLHVQYWRFLTHALRGDLGRSLLMRREVTDIILDELPFTIRLGVLGWALLVFLGLSFGITAALNVNTWLDSAIMAVAISGMAMPNFWLAIMLILFFCVRLGWLPIFGPESLKVMILPAFVLGFPGSAMISRMTRSGVLEALSQDYIRTARAKGLREYVVIVRHALKNALIPVVTMMGLYLGGLLSGALVVETVFARRGIGYVTVNGILARDYPLAQGTVLFVAVVFVTMNLIVDIVYAYIDPRIHYD